MCGGELIFSKMLEFYDYLGLIIVILIIETKACFELRKNNEARA